MCKQIQSLCSAKATGYDKISARLLKTAAPQISDSLCYVINLSLKSGAVPKEWKHARVIPLYKYGKCNEASNYRPISVLPIISKIMERIVHDQLYTFIEENNILNKWQSGFRPGYSTETAMTYVTDLLLTEMASKKLTGVVFFDLKKAFDTVDHALLLTKLRNYGIRGDEHSWFTSYLTYRTQSVSLEKVTSDSMDISYGVPQRSILGPLLLCTAGQTGCLPWLAVVCMYHRRRSCRIAYGRHHVIVCVQSCVCSEGEHTLHISCCFGGRRQISLRLLY